jgi:hypothetical protein
MVPDLARFRGRVPARAEFVSGSRRPMKRRRDLVFAVLVVAYVLYLAAIVWRSSMLIAGERFFSLNDDSMISMRYARNLAEGHGLVWNAGERPIEGYTNLLWVLVMAVAHALVPVSKASGAVQALSLTLLVVNLFVIRRIADEVGAGAVGSVGAALLTALYYPLTAWSLQGSELALLVPVIGIAVAVGIRNSATERFSSAPYWLLGAATLARLDIAVVYVGLLAALASLDRARRAAHLTYGVGVLVLFAAAQTAFRYSYYGEWLPNTYYLKMTGYPALWRIAWGVRDLAGFAWHKWIVFVLAAIGLYRRPRDGAIVAAAAGAQFAYAAYIGPADNRFTTLVMPLVFVLAAVGAEALAAAGVATGLLTRPGRQTALACAALAAVGASMLHPETLRFRGFPASILERDRALDDLTTADARIAVCAAGTLYFLDRPGVDVLGKNDHALARAPVHRSFRRFGAGYVSGHMKWDYAYSIGTLAPDVVAELWRYPEDAAPYLQAYEPRLIGGETLYFRRGSPRIRWDRLPSRQDLAAQQ